MNHIEKARDQLKHCTSIIACKDDKEIKKVLKSLSKEGYSLSTRAINDEYIHQFEDIDRAVYFATFDNEKRKEIKKVLKSLSKEGYSLSTRAINDEYIHQFEDIDRAVYFATFDNEKRVEEFLEVTLFLMEKEDMEVFLDKTILGKDIPNEETIEAIQKVKEMEKNPSKFKGYYSFDEKEDMEVFLDKTILGKDIPNEETIEAIQKVKEMEKNPSKFKGYYSFDEIIDEIEQEGEDES